MAKFKNKKTGKIVEEHLLFYVNKMRSNPNYVEVKEKNAQENENNVQKNKNNVQKSQEVGNKPLQ